MLWTRAVDMLLQSCQILFIVLFGAAGHTNIYVLTSVVECKFKLLSVQFFLLLTVYLVIYLTFLSWQRNFWICYSAYSLLSSYLNHFTFRVHWPDIQLFCLWSYCTVWIMLSHIYLHLTFPCAYRNFICLCKLPSGTF